MCRYAGNLARTSNLSNAERHIENMTILDLINQMLPEGTDVFSLSPALAAYEIFDCPTWPPDLFAVTGRAIELSGCYTMASPEHGTIGHHRNRLEHIEKTVLEWNEDPVVVPGAIEGHWRKLVDVYGHLDLGEVESHPDACRCLLELFGYADEACKGIGWGVSTGPTAPFFAEMALACISIPEGKPNLLHVPHSLCAKVSPSMAVVLPKSITASVGCTIRSLSHHMSLLPPTTVVKTSWRLPSAGRAPAPSHGVPAAPYDIRVLLIPYPFRIPSRSFELTEERQKISGSHYWPAYFGLKPRWLEDFGTNVTGEKLAVELINELIVKAKIETGAGPNGIVLPECALTEAVAHDLVEALADSGVEFVITGVTHQEKGKAYNRACTFVIDPATREFFQFTQNKHHRWRLDRTQTDRYALDFDRDPDNDKWWEDIDVSCRTLPFFGLRKDMSFVTLICEDLARSDPAMSVIRAVGPNLVVALLMDGPQLAARWPGKYATVLAEDPGSAVLTVTSAGMVDRANWPESRPARSIALWREASGKVQEIPLPEGAHGVLLTLQSKKKHQSTLDLRSDQELSRQLKLRTIIPISLDDPPSWV